MKHLSELRDIIKNLKLQNPLETVCVNKKHILLLGFLPSLIAKLLFPNVTFLEFIQHGIAYLNYPPLFLILFIMYILGFAISFIRNKRKVDSKFKIMFESLIGIAFFMTVFSLFYTGHYFGISNTDEAIFFVMISIMFLAETLGFTCILMLIDLFEYEILYLRKRKNTYG
jgi:hypothetical protein